MADDNDSVEGGFRPDQKVGQGRYTLIRFLGKGGMGVVWLARDQHLRDEVALKFLPLDIHHDPEALEDMRRETLKSRKLTHPNIIRIHDLHVVAGESPFISMEYVDGRALSWLKAQERQRLFGWDYLRPLVAQLCEALNYAHGESVIHRDIKPGNMMLDSRGRLKLADFGIAAVVSESVSRVSMQTSTGGTLGYMSPQQLNGQPPRVSDDIYALGATLYELLTSKPPFFRGDIYRQVQDMDAAPMRERLAELGLSNEIPAATAAVVMASLSKDPAKRPQSAAIFARLMGLDVGVGAERDVSTGQAIQAPGAPEDPRAQAASGPEASVHELSESKPAKSTQHRTAWVVAVAAGVVVLGLVGWYLSRHPTSNRSEMAVKPGPKKETSGVKSEVAKAPAPAKPAMISALPAAAADVRFTNSLGMVFVPVPGTKVRFSIWETRVKDYQAFVSATGRERVSVYFEAQQTPLHPQVWVTWEDAKAFCTWLSDKERKTGVLSEGQNYRIPTDEEWSWATGIGDREGAGTPELKGSKLKDVYPWGNQWPPPKGAGNYPTSLAVDSFEYTAPVGSFAANKLGLFDLGGNAAEWCEDFYDGLSGPRVVRDAGWYGKSVPESLTSSFRFHQMQNWHGRNYGFRCVLETPGSKP